MSKYGNCQFYQGKFSLKIVENSSRKKLKFELIFLSAPRPLSKSSYPKRVCGKIVKYPVHTSNYSLITKIFANGN